MGGVNGGGGQRERDRRYGGSEGAFRVRPEEHGCKSAAVQEVSAVGCEFLRVLRRGRGPGFETRGTKQEQGGGAHKS